MYKYGKCDLLKPPTIFGRKLAPLSLGHIDILDALDHPFMNRSGLTPHELAIAVWVCSQSRDQAAARIRSGKLRHDLRRLFRRMWLYDVPSAGVALSEYLDVFMQAPPQLGNQPVPRRIPWHRVILAALQEKTNLTITQAWDLPLPQALEFFEAICAANGDESIKQSGDRARKDGV